ncbi:MAG: hypothetical protein E2590_09185 [Chryseobacterium sp.]|nr:hypothetical protein [Chryseobacterium sp.]
MREIFYNSDITPKAIDEIKLLSLYYDKINIVNDTIYSPLFGHVDGKFSFTGVEDLQFVPKDFNDNYKLLIEEGIVSLTQKSQSEENEYDQALKKNISKILNANHDILYPKHPLKDDTRIITEEVYDVMKYMFDFDWSKPVEVNCVWYYYALKLQWFLKLLNEGKNCLSSSNNLNYLFNAFIKDFSTLNSKIGRKGYSKSLALDAIKISLPNPSILEFDDILELKIKLKDELSLFSQTINSIETKYKEIFGSDIEDNEYKAIFFDEIEKPLKDLEVKIKNLRSRTFRNFVDKMQNPKSYVPLIGTVIATIPFEYSLFTSLGLITGQSYLEYKEDKREIANNGLYFLLKIK